MHVVMEAYRHVEIHTETYSDRHTNVHGTCTLSRPAKPGGPPDFSPQKALLLSCLLGPGLTCVQLAAFLLRLLGGGLDGPLSLRMDLQEGFGKGGRARHPQGHDAVHTFALGPFNFGTVLGGRQQDQFGELPGLLGGCRDDTCARLRGLR